jgi:hypothetical protein
MSEKLALATKKNAFFAFRQLQQEDSCLCLLGRFSERR